MTPAIEIQGAIRTAGGGCWIHVQDCPSVTHDEQQTLTLVHMTNTKCLSRVELLV